MCGFVGYFGPNDIDLENSRVSIDNRGPDMSNIKSGTNWKVAFNRLSIHDLSEHGMQPFEYNETTVYMNGEIFNYIELQDEHKDEFISCSGSDVEIIPFLYEKYGIEFLDKLNGMFAIVLIDKKENISYLIRDRFAEKPLYYNKDCDHVYFASEVKAIKKIKDLEIDKTNIKINFACWFLPQPLSLYKDTFSVNPGSYIEYSNGNILEKRWYHPKINKSNMTEAEIEKKFTELYRSSIELRLRSDVNVGVFLSGGLDSTSIAKISNDIKSQKISAFGAEIIGKELQENNTTDVVIPKMLSDQLGIKYNSRVLDYDYYNKNIVKIVRNFDEVFMNSGILIYYALSDLAKENKVKVILTGMGGDELFGGYPWQSGVARKIDKVFRLTYSKLPYNELLSKTVIFLNKKLAAAYQLLFDYKVWHAETLSSFRYDFKKDKVVIEKTIRDNAQKYFKLSEKHMYYDIYNMMAYANTFTLIGAGNHSMDISTMESSIENRSPFYDYRLFEFLMSVPDVLKIKHGHKGMLRKFLTKHLPGYVTNAKKSGPTMPLTTWLYGKQILPDIKKFLYNNMCLIQEYLSVDICDKLNDTWIDDKRNSLKLFAIINFIIWAKINILEETYDENITLNELLRRT